MPEEDDQLPGQDRTTKIVRGALQVVGGAIPFAGGLFSAAAGAWSENEQERVNKFFKAWLKMLHEEIREKERTILEIMSRLDIHDEEIAKRIESREYQSLLKKTFREWSAAESEDKRTYIRNILANAAASKLTSDEVIRLFIDWLKMYSELHFKVIGVIYQHGNEGVTRRGVWEDLGKEAVADNSADAGSIQAVISGLEYWRSDSTASGCRLLRKVCS